MIIAPQADDVIFGCMKDLFDLRRTEQVIKRFDIHNQRVDQVIRLLGGDLHQADPFMIGEQAVGFGVHGDDG